MSALTNDEFIKREAEYKAAREYLAHNDRLKKDYPPERMLLMPEVQASREAHKKHGHKPVVHEDEETTDRAAVTAVERATGLSRKDAGIVVMHAGDS